MNPGLVPLLGVGFLLGLRHAFEADHLAAVTTLATRQGSLRDAARLGAAWGTGHTLAVGGVATIVIGLGVRMPEAVSRAAESLVALLLIGLGAAVLWRAARRHRAELDGSHALAHAAGHAHDHAPPIRDARRSLGFGLAHGLAGSGAVMVLLVAAASTHQARASYLLAFGFGTIAGMLAVSVAIVALMRIAARRNLAWVRRMHLASACASVAAGLLLAASLTHP